MKKPKEPIGKFIIDNEKGTQTENGVYYHYTEVCRLLKLYEKQLLIHSVVGRSEQLKNGAKFTYHEWIDYNFKKVSEDKYKQKLDHMNLVFYTERELRGKWAASKRVF